MIKLSLAAVSLFLMATPAPAESFSLVVDGPWVTQLNVKDDTQSCELINTNGDNSFSLTVSSDGNVTAAMWLDIVEPGGTTFIDLHLEFSGNRRACGSSHSLGRCADTENTDQSPSSACWQSTVPKGLSEDQRNDFEVAQDFSCEMLFCL